jgi:hypothetical protein
MKLKNLLASGMVVLALTACEVAEGGTTAADSAEVNQKDNKGKNTKAKSADEGDKADKADKGSQETVSQANARESAESYLDFSAFFRSGLIEQLEFEGFTREQAEYGATANGL